MVEKYIDPLFISKYLFLYNSNSQNAKRLKRKFNKKKILPLFHTKEYKQFDEDAVKLLQDFLKVSKSQGTNEHIGFISDACVVQNNIVNIPPPPLSWDILCLQSQITQYNFKNKDNNIYWCESKVANTCNFIINNNFIENLLYMLKECTTWTKLMEQLNKRAQIFSVTQYTFSEHESEYINVPFDRIYSKTTNQQERDILWDRVALDCEDVLRNDTSIKLNSASWHTNVTISENVKQNLPKVSCVCVVSDANKTFQVLMTFLKLDYPSDKLELVLVDDIDAEKKLKNILPNDPRIKMVNLTKKDPKTGELMRLPFGYKLNMGVKYASHNMIFHLFDTHVYVPSKFCNVIGTFLMSGRELCMSIDSGLYGKNSDESFVNDVPDIGNAVYFKNFWKVRPFNEKQDISSILVYHFVKARTMCGMFLPFVTMSFKVLDQMSSEKKETYKKLPFNLRRTVESSLQESFCVSHNLHSI